MCDDTEQNSTYDSNSAVVSCEPCVSKPYEYESGSLVTGQTIEPFFVELDSKTDDAPIIPLPSDDKVKCVDSVVMVKYLLILISVHACI